jgi:hypothetical protein
MKSLNYLLTENSVYYTCLRRGYNALSEAIRRCNSRQVCTFTDSILVPIPSMKAFTSIVVSVLFLVLTSQVVSGVSWVECSDVSNCMYDGYDNQPSGNYLCRVCWREVQGIRFLFCWHVLWVSHGLVLNEGQHLQIVLLVQHRVHENELHIQFRFLLRCVRERQIPRLTVWWTLHILRSSESQKSLKCWSPTISYSQWLHRFHLVSHAFCEFSVPVAGIIRLVG